MEDMCARVDGVVAKVHELHRKYYEEGIGRRDCMIVAHVGRPGALWKTSRRLFRCAHLTRLPLHIPGSLPSRAHLTLGGVYPPTR